MNLDRSRSAEEIAVSAGSPASKSDREIERRTLRKAGWRLLPLLSICYAVAFVDRANVSYAALQMNRDLHFNAAVYGFGASVFFISYAVCELPANYLLLKFGARRWIARIMLTWGVLAAAAMFVRTPVSFYVLRFLLGMAEAGFFPGVLYYLSLWFPQEMRSRAISRFYVAFPLANVLMGLFAGSLLGLNGRFGLRGWQWLFLVEALPALVLGGVVLFTLPDGPETARWLKPEERLWLLERLLRDRREIGGLSRRHVGLLSVLGDARVMLVGFFFLLTLGSSYAFSFSGPQIFTAITGWSAGRVGFLLAAMSLVGAAAMQIVAWISDRQRVRLPWIVGLSLVMALGFLVSGVARSPWIVVPAVSVAMVSFYGLEAPALSLITTFLEGPAAAMGIAAINTLAIIGGFLGPNWIGWSITRTGDWRWGLGLLSVPCALGAVLMLWFRQVQVRSVAGSGRGLRPDEPEAVATIP